MTDFRQIRSHTPNFAYTRSLNWCRIWSWYGFSQYIFQYFPHIMLSQVILSSSKHSPLISTDDSEALWTFLFHKQVLTHVFFTDTRMRVAWRGRQQGRHATCLLELYNPFPLHITYTFHMSQTKNKLELLIPDPAWPAAISHTWNLVWRLLSATLDDCSEEIEDTIHKSQGMFRASEGNCWTKASIIAQGHTVIRMSSMDLSTCLKLKLRN
jgi:hypothetical protein